MVMGTRAHQLALFVVFESALQAVADHPSAYEGQPGFEFLRAVPAARDETRVLNARVGEYVTIARRRGKEWYVGSLTDWSSRELTIPLDFLSEGRYTAEVYADAPDSEHSPKNVVVETRNVDRTMQPKVHLASGGGHAMRIRP